MDWAPPSTAASACSETLTTLLSGCWAVKVAPAVWAWKRSCRQRGSVAPKRSAMSWAQRARADRNLATSSKKSLSTLKKKLSRGANSASCSPALRAAST